MTSAASQFVAMTNDGNFKTITRARLLKRWRAAGRAIMLLKGDSGFSGVFPFLDQAAGELKEPVLTRSRECGRANILCG